MRSRFVKNVVDYVLALAALVTLSPVLAATALAVRVKLGRPVLFAQQRPGLHGRPFLLYKFRTMTDERDADGNLTNDEARLTSFGAWLRRRSLDELPQLFNVIRGELSLVGPRPLLMEYLPLYSPEQARRHDVKPGITGWAQVNGRNAIGWEQKFALDVWYVDNWSVTLDMKILRMTAANVLHGHGISQEGRATMEKFKGNAPC